MIDTTTAAPRITIIGGGFSGTMVAAHLLCHTAEPLQIQVVESKPQVGRGVAYDTTAACCRLNVAAGRMSAFADDPDHFLDWLRERPELAAGDQAASFMPRSLYGAYLEDVLAAAEADATPGVTLERVTGTALALRSDGDGAVVRISKERIVYADRVVLALGQGAPADPPVADPSFYSSQRYIRNPWSSHALEGLPLDAPVLLIGTGLTMIDLASTLAERGHRGAIYAISRRGLLPHVHRDRAAYPQFLDADDASAPLSPLLRRVRMQIRAAELQGKNWRDVIDALRPVVQRLWSDASEIERRRFLRHLQPYWDVHRHRIAPEVAAGIADLRASGQLRIFAGRIQCYQEGLTDISVSFRSRSSQVKTTLSVARVINCTGPSCDYRRGGTPLVRDLIAEGLAVADPLGLGLVTAPNGMLLEAGGGESAVLATLGPLRKGQLWETTAVPEIRVQAAELAQTLLTSLGMTWQPAEERQAVTG